MKKKTITICAFGLIILITVIYTLVSAVSSYRYDMDPANGVDILEGFGAVLILIVGTFVVLYEVDMFCTVYYFCVKPKTMSKSILHIFSNISLLLVFFNGFYKDIFAEDVLAPLIVFVIYIVLRVTSFVIPDQKSEQNKLELF